jgi:hypothetical protein
MSSQRLLLEHLFQDAHTAGSLAYIKVSVLYGSQACTVISAIFQPPETGDEDRTCLVTSCVTDNPTHDPLLLASHRAFALVGPLSSS